MAYGSTAGMSTTSTIYSSAPRVQGIVDRFGSGGRSVFIYPSTHSHTDIEATGFFTNGKRDGLQVGDLLINLPLSTAGSSAASIHVVSASTGAVAASDTAGSSAYSQAYNVSVTGFST